MEQINVLFVAVGFVLCTSHFFVQTLPIRYHERNLKDKIPPTPNDALTKISNRAKIPQGLPPPGRSVGLVLFPLLAEAENKAQNRTKPNIPGDQSSKNSSPDTTNRPTEMTISMPNYKTDTLGNVVFGKSTQSGDGDGEADSDEDESPKSYNRGNPSNQRAPAAQRRGRYRPPFSHSFPVCAHRSTIYNFPKVLGYLKPRLYDRVYATRAVWLDLREAIYKDGNSQECHVATMTDWTKFIHCSIRRNMRMEYLVPKYPLHQQGFYFYPKNLFM